MCNQVEFSLRHPNLARFHGGLDENQVERLFNTHGFHGKGLLFFLYSLLVLLRARDLSLTEVVETLKSRHSG